MWKWPFSMRDQRHLPLTPTALSLATNTSSGSPEAEGSCSFMEGAGCRGGDPASVPGPGWGFLFPALGTGVASPQAFGAESGEAAGLRALRHCVTVRNGYRGARGCGLRARMKFGSVPSVPCGGQHARVDDPAVPRHGLRFHFVGFPSTSGHEHPCAQHTHAPGTVRDGLHLGTQ